MADVAVLVPVLGRPLRVAPLLESLLLAEGKHRTWPLFICSPGDRAQIDAVRAETDDYLVVPFAVGPGDYARKIQVGFEQTDSEFVFLAADDLTFEPGWADAAVAQIERSGVGVCGTYDGANTQVKRGRHSTHSLVRRSYVEEQGGAWGEPGQVLHAGYSHQFSDNELVELARARGEWVFCREARVLHHHPLFDKSVRMDATYERALAGGRADMRLFVERRRAWQRSARLYIRSA